MGAIRGWDPLEIQANKKLKKTRLWERNFVDRQASFDPNLNKIGGEISHLLNHSFGEAFTVPNPPKHNIFRENRNTGWVFFYLKNLNKTFVLEVF